MTYKEKKEILEGYISCQHKIVGLQKELENWETIATSITQKITPVIVNTNDNNSKVETCAIKCVEIQQKIIDEIKSAQYNRNIVQDAIERMKDTRKRDILTMRYVNGMSVSDIAIKLNKDRNNIYKMIRTGIRNVEL